MPKLELEQDRRCTVTDKSNMVSILIPTFQREGLLIQSLSSAMHQTYENLDIVVCDNASSDNSVKIAQSISSRDPRVRIYKWGHNIGWQRNFRNLLDLAYGSYTKFLMSDDLLLPTAVESLILPLQLDDTISLSTSVRQFIDSSGNMLQPSLANRPILTNSGVIRSEELARLVLTSNTNVIGEPTTTMFRTRDLDSKTIGTYRGTNFRFLLDLASWFTLMEGGNVAYNINTLSAMRIHDGSMSMGSNVLSFGHAEWFDLIRAAGRTFFKNKVEFLRSVETALRAAMSLSLTVTDDREVGRIASIVTKANTLMLDELPYFENSSKLMDKQLNPKAFTNPPYLTGTAPQCVSQYISSKIQLWLNPDKDNNDDTSIQLLISDDDRAQLVANEDWRRLETLMNDDITLGIARFGNHAAAVRKEAIDEIQGDLIECPTPSTIDRIAAEITSRGWRESLALAPPKLPALLTGAR